MFRGSLSTSSSFARLGRSLKQTEKAIIVRVYITMVTYPWQRDSISQQIGRGSSRLPAEGSRSRCRTLGKGSQRLFVSQFKRMMTSLFSLLLVRKVNVSRATPSQQLCWCPRDVSCAYPHEAGAGAIVGNVRLKMNETEESTRRRTQRNELCIPVIEKLN